MARRDPWQVCRFAVEMEGVTVGGFARVKGLARETKFETFREGGVNDFEYKLASLTTYGNLVLERGFAATELWNWHDAVVGGAVTRRKITVALRDEQQQDVRRWHVDGAFPVRWSLGDFDASAGTVLVETIEFAHHGLRAS